jgi:hypothetical protein
MLQSWGTKYVYTIKAEKDQFGDKGIDGRLKLNWM